MNAVKRWVKWAFLHEPAIIAGIISGVAIYLAIRYGTKANGAVQGLAGSSIALAFGFLRNFVTAPGNVALTDAQKNLPNLYHDVNTLWSALGDAMKHPKGLAGVLADHMTDVQQAIADGVQRVRSIVRGATPGVPVEPSKGLMDSMGTTMAAYAPQAPVDDPKASGGSLAPVAPATVTISQPDSSLPLDDVDPAPAAEPAVPAAVAPPAEDVDPIAALKAVADG